MNVPLSINDPAFSRLTPELQRILCNICQDARVIAHIAPFLDTNYLTSPIGIAQALAGPTGNVFYEGYVEHLKAEKQTPLQIASLLSYLRSLCVACEQSLKKSSPSLSPTVSPSDSSTPSSPASKRASSSDSTTTPKRAKDEGPRTFNPTKFAFLNTTDARFWSYAIVFAELLVPVHPTDSRCPGCNKDLSSNLPYNFWTHCYTKCPSGAGAFLATKPNPIPPPQSLPPPEIAARFGTLSHEAKAKLPQAWYPFLDQSIAAIVRDPPAAALATSPVPLVPPGVAPVPPSASLSLISSDEPLPALMDRSDGSFGSSASGASISSFLRLDGNATVDPMAVFLQAPNQHSHS